MNFALHRMWPQFLFQATDGRANQEEMRAVIAEFL